jgi:hypothetical protein
MKYHSDELGNLYSIMCSKFRERTQRDGKVHHLMDSLEVLVKSLKQYFEEFGLNSTAFLDGRFVEESHDLSHIIQAQYKEVLATAIDLGMTTIQPEYISEAQNSPGDIAFTTLHDTTTLLLDVEPVLNRMAIEWREVLHMLQGNSNNEDVKRDILYSSIVLRVKNWQEQLSQLDQMLNPPPDRNLGNYLAYSSPAPSTSEDEEN